MPHLRLWRTIFEANGQKFICYKLLLKLPVFPIRKCLLDVVRRCDEHAELLWLLVTVKLAMKTNFGSSHFVALWANGPSKLRACEAAKTPAHRPPWPRNWCLVNAYRVRSMDQLSFVWWYCVRCGTKYILSTERHIGARGFDGRCLLLYVWTVRYIYTVLDLYYITAVNTQPST